MSSQPPQWGQQGKNPDNAGQNLGPSKPGLPPPGPPLNHYSQPQGIPTMPNITPNGPSTWQVPVQPGPGVRLPVPPGPNAAPPYLHYNSVQSRVAPPESVPRNNSAPDMFSSPPRPVGPPASRPALGPPLTNGAPYQAKPNTDSTRPTGVRPPVPQANGPQPPLVPPSQPFPPGVVPHGQPHPPRLGSQGQVVNRSMSSPPVTGPIAATSVPGQPLQPTQLPGFRPGLSHPHQPVSLNSTFPPAIRPPAPLPTSGPPSGRPSELPMPYHGQAQYSQQVRPALDTGLTPGSEPVSQKSSRAPSPVPAQNYDALEGQFTPLAAPGPPGGTAPFPGHVPRMTTPTTSAGHVGVTNVVAGLPVQPPVAGAPPGMAPPAGPPASVAGVSATPPSTSRPGLTANRYPQMPPQAGGYTGPPHPPGQYAHTSPPGPPTGPPGQYPQTNPPGHFPQPYQPRPYPVTSQPGGIPHPALASQDGQAGGQYPPGPTHPGGVTPASLPGQGYVPPMSMAPNYMSSSGTSSAATLTSNFSNMSIQPDVTRPLNLLQEKRLIPTDGVETSVPNLPADYKKVNCNPDIFRCTLNAIPNSPTLLNKSRLPLGILIHPFKDLTQLPVIQSNVIVRCRSCRTYINPFVSFVDSRRWKCNLCYRNNELPDEFNYDPVSKTYGEPQRRPEIRSSTIEFIAPSEYMLRPPQAAEYLFVLDVSFNAIGTGYLKLFCETMLEELERLPGDTRTHIGFMTYDTSLHFYNLQEGLSQPQMLVVSDIDDVFLPLPEGLLVNLQESKELIIDLLNNLPAMFEHTVETGSALGAALQAAFKLMSPTGGRVSVFQTLLPTAGPGGLKNREDPNERAGKKIQNLGPATDFYKKLALDCSAQQVAVDLFMLNAQYADLASITGISKYSGGCVHYFPGMHIRSNPAEAERFEGMLRRYLTRKIGFEAVMRIRCSRGISLHTFHGNFFVRSTDLLSLPNINPDAGFGMQMSIEDNIETNYFSFQAALLYTSSKGERRIRVHTLCVPVTSSITEVFAHADQQAIAGLLAKMAVDKSLSQSVGDARDALVNSVVDMLGAYGSTLTTAQRMGQLPCPFTLRLMAMYVLALLKYMAFRVGTSTRLDERVDALEKCKNLPLGYLLQEAYPDLYPVHMLDERNALSKGDLVVCQPPLLHLSSANVDRHGAYVMDTHSRLYLWVGGAISDRFCQDVFDVQTFQQVPDGASDLPELENETSERLRTFIGYLSDQKPCPPSIQVIREDSPSRGQFISRLVEDRGESTFSYYEFLQHLQKEVK